MNTESPERLRELGKLVQGRRIALGYRQAKDLAESIGITPRVIYDVENGNRRVGSPTYTRIENDLIWRSGSIEDYLAGGEEPTVAIPRPTGDWTQNPLIAELRQTKRAQIIDQMREQIAIQQAQVDGLKHALQLLIDQEEGGDNGSQTPPQKNDLEERRALRDQEVSDVDDTLSPAADDVHKGVDEEPGGSDDLD